MDYDTNDDAGQMIWEGDEIAGSGGRTQTNYYRYPDGSVAHLHYPGGVYLRHDYTARGQLAAAGWDDDDNNWWMKLAAYTYLPDGKVGQMDYGNGMRTGFDHDERGMTRVVHHYRVSPYQNRSWRSYWRDERDRITAFEKSGDFSSNPMEDGRGDRFHYDEEGQLLEGWYNATDPANSGAGNTRYDGFAYDALGNRTQNNYVASRGLTSFIRRDNGLNQYSSWTPSVIYHDDNYPGWSAPGNGVMMAEGWITASYNALNQPIAIWSPNMPSGAFTWFGYDPLGRCVKRWVSDSGDLYSNPATYFHYDGWNLLQEGNNAWGPARVYVHGTRVDEIVWSYNPFTGDQAFHHYDARGHCTLLTDSLGNIMEQYEYDAFGHPYFYDAAGGATLVNGQPGSPFGNRFLFTGRELLTDLRLYDYRNRMYQPELGRFLQPDPKEFGAGDYNLYRYCHNDPVNHTDPDGLAMFGLYDSYGDYFADVGQVFIGEAKGAGNILSLGIYQPSYPNDNQRYGGYVGQALAVVGVAAATKAEPARPAGLNPQQAANLARFEAKLPANASETKTLNAPGGGKIFQADSAGKVPGSYARYEKQVDASGKTVGYTKTTIGPKGEVISVKDKIRDLPSK
jgi:RHS repeat-associated protein